jgi:hypothetical protein
MLIFIIIVAVTILAWIILIYVRKSLWDIVHRNLLALADNFEGKVIRKNFLNRPVFHGKVDETPLTLSFSTAKSDKGRITYLNISLDLPTKTSLTLSAKKWLEEQNAGELKDFVELENDYGEKFIIRPASNMTVKNLMNENILREFINEFRDLAYFFSGRTGVLCEYIIERAAESTGFDQISKRLLMIKNLSRAVQ